MALAESVSWFLRQGLIYERLTSDSSWSLCGVKVLVLPPQLAEIWGYSAHHSAWPHWLSLGLFWMQGLVCTAPMPCAPHLGFLICSLSWPLGMTGHTTVLTQVPSEPGQSICPSLSPSCFPPVASRNRFTGAPVELQPWPWTLVTGELA